MNGDHTYTNCTFNGPRPGSREERTMIAAMTLQGLLSNPNIGMPGTLKAGDRTPEQAFIMDNDRNGPNFSDELHCEIAMTAIDLADALLREIKLKDPAP